VNFLSHSLSFSFAWISSAKELIVQEFPSRIAVLSDDVPLVVSRQLLQSFAQELGKLEPEAQKDIAHYALAQIQPRVVSFEEQVRFAQAIGSRLFSCKLYKFVIGKYDCLSWSSTSYIFPVFPWIEFILFKKLCYLSV